MIFLTNTVWYIIRFCPIQVPVGIFHAGVNQSVSAHGMEDMTVLTGHHTRPILTLNAAVFVAITRSVQGVLTTWRSWNTNSHKSRAQNVILNHDIPDLPIVIIGQAILSWVIVSTE